ncbi:MAG: hypothetical protein ABS35_35035 [Kaistia sp. SCN 65-12]|nr:MAG: hypothetical protein ABS35_35035 [Kaistia sp. SCN 65-12]
MKIDRLEIASLRGIPSGWPELVIGDKGLIVYGPNGVGKSSIIDALEAAVAGRSTLFADERQGVSWETASQHVRGGPPQVTVRGALAGKRLELCLGAPPPPELADWADAASTTSFVLRRYMLLRFIDAQPKQRYAQIEPFLNLSDFAKFETELKELCLKLETELATLTNQTNTKAEIIRRSFKLDGNVIPTQKDLIGTVARILRLADVTYPDGTQPTLAELEASVLAGLGNGEAGQRIATLGVARHSALQITSPKLLAPLIEGALSAATELTRELGASCQKAPVELLAQALAHMQATNAIECPVCEHAVEHTSLISRLEERIREDAAVQRAHDTLVERLKVLNSASLAARRTFEAFAETWQATLLGDLPGEYNTTPLFDKLEQLTVRSPAEQFEHLRDECVAADCDPSAMIAELDAAIQSAGGSERRAILMRCQDLIELLKNEFNDHADLLTQSTAATNRSILAAKFHRHAEDARKAAVQMIADGVAELANKFYEEIHPNEGIANSTLLVRKGTTGSFDLKTTFHGQVSPPLLYYSEAHLDTLGLCYFLAIRKLDVEQNQNFRLLLIDDVLHSVDADHRVRLARLLKNHFGEFQIVLVTHDLYFYQRLRDALGSSYKYLSISGWDIERGPQLSDPLTDLDRVVDTASREQRSHPDLAAAGGRFFEWLLKGLTERLEVSVQARFSRDHDIGSLWPALSKKLLKHKGFAATNKVIVDGLNDHTWVRNKIGAHDNDAAAPPTPKEVDSLLDLMRDLYEATHCTTCNEPVRPEKNDVWRCNCSKLHYGK